MLRDIIPASQGSNTAIGFPDYQNGYNVSSYFIAPENGWIYSSGNGRWTTFINGNPVRQQILNSDQADGAIAPVSRGDIVKIQMTQGGSSSPSMLFYPCK